MDVHGNFVLVFLVIHSLSFSFADDGSSKLKAVTAALHTRWSETPLLLEASEFFFDENPALFWKFLEQVQALVTSSENGDDMWTEKEQYDSAISIAQSLLSPVKQNFLHLSLALRYYSARVQMYRQILETENITEKCSDVLVDFGGGLLTCGFSEVKSAFLDPATFSRNNSTKMNLISLDHHHAGSRKIVPIVIAYGNILRPQFWLVHDFLLSHRNEFHYVFRHYLPSGHDSSLKVRIPGYGVEMAIKSTEYKAQDDSKIKEGSSAETGDGLTDDEDLDTDIEGFDFGRLKLRHSSKKEQLEQLKAYLLHSTGTELQALKAWQYQDLSLQAAEKVIKIARLHPGSSTDSLKILRDISQNFPTQAPTLLRIPVQEEVKGEIQRNRDFFAHYHGLEPGAAALFINGLHYDTDILDPFTLFDKLREENRLLETMHGFGIKGQDLTSILELDLRPTNNAKYGVDFRHPAVHFVNDLEKDSRYADWPSSVRDLVRQTFPPTLLKAIRKNFYNLILVIDPTKPSENQDILRLTESFYVHKLPIRVGLAFLTTEDGEIDGTKDASVALHNAYKFVEEKKSGHSALSFLTDVYQSSGDDEKMTPENIIAYFGKKFPKEKTDDIFGPKSVFEAGRQDGRAFTAKLNLGRAPLALLNGVPLDRTKLNAEDFENEVLMEIVNVYSALQRDVQSGELTDYSDVIEHLLAKPHIVPRLNEQILSPTSVNILEFGGKSVDPEKYTFEAFQKLKAVDRTATMAAASFYLTKHEDDGPHPVTMWIVGDPETSAGRDLFYTAIKLSKSSKNVRIGFVYNPTSVDQSGEYQITKAVQVAIETQSMQFARNYVTKLLKEENVAELRSGSKTLQDFEVNGMDMEAFNSGLQDVSMDFLKIHSSYSQDELSLKPGETAVVTNGYIVGPLDKTFGADDLQLLEKYISSYGASKLVTEVDRLHIFSSHEQVSDVVMMTSALLSGLGSSEATKKRTKVQYSETEHSIISIDEKEPDHPAFDVAFIVDPLSKEAQKIAPLLMVLHETLNCRIRIFFNCREKLSELPLKSFYRMVLEPRLTFTDNGSISPNFAVARFTSLPQSSLLTMNFQPPDNWLTEARYAVHDLDNIKLEEVNGWGVHGQFELMNLLLEGSAKDQTTDQPPRGTQFILGTPSDPYVVDTIVMANLGYFQLKANPGSWNIRLREGRSRDIYSIASSEGAELDGSDEEQIRVVISSFSTKSISIHVKKRSGMEREDVLSDASRDGKKVGTGILDSISSYWATEDEEETVNKDDVINIFSLASGHLYERFLRLMMLSVIKTTKTPVKFWFLKNYLSPQFKEFLPYMAKHYGFQFELVEYKWPRWLNRQSDKQRLIWGYKILFLDVLFPLSVKKIIFVDADQIVRADMKELRDLDLEGAPYGYTPFCDSRTEMEGFRFWKNGYWATHLGYRKYHISALYVVDLVKFRKIAAGDRLRAQYQGLSQDPNSLSNLDQDLPNNMIYQVPIKSLPQDWLWCETWCDEQSKPRAKTIDLCNNPLTKEPKLTSAMRIIPEWKSYDDEVRDLLEKFHAEKSGKMTEGAPVEPTVDDVKEANSDFSNEIPIHGGRDEL